MLKNLIILLFIPFLCYSQNTLDFETALHRVLDQSSILKISQADIDVNAASIVQSSFYPNPIISAEIEQIGGYGGWQSIRNPDTTVVLSQLIETGNKRNLRMNIATYDYSAALLDYEITKLQILNAFKKAYIKAFAAQENWKLAQKRKNIANEVYKLVSSKVQAGKVSIIQQTKAQIDYSNAEMNFEQTYLDFQTAKERLSSIWGSSCPDFDVIEYPFYAITTPLCFDACKECIKNNPYLVKSQLYYSQAYEKIRLEKSFRIPDVILSAGYEVEPGCGGLVVGVSVPLPLFDRNQGNIAGAYAEAIRADNEISKMQIMLESKLSHSHKKLLNSFSSVNRLNNTLLSASKHALELAQEGYKEGKFEYLEVLDSQRTFFDIESQYINALVDYHLAQIDIDYLNSQTE